MIALDRGLAKLTLEAFQGDGRQKKVGAFTAMYNPESVTLDYTADYNTAAGVNQHHEVSWYQQVKPPTLRLKLILDARGPQRGKPVDEQLRDLRALCFSVGERGEPPYLRVNWGSMSWHGHGYFSGRLINLFITYTLFDRNAKPLRATASLVLRAQTSDEMATLKGASRGTSLGLQVQDKTSLPQLLAQSTAAVGGAAYLAVAYANDVDNLSGLLPGQMLLAR